MACPIKKWQNYCGDIKDSWLFILFLIITLVTWIFGSKQELFLFINSHHALLPDQFWQLFNFISYSHFFILPALLLIITVLKRRNKVANVIILIIAYYLVFTTFKQLIGEARPYIILPQGHFFWLNNYENAVKSSYKSFPSGHTGNAAIFAFAISTMFFQNKRGLQFLMLFMVIIVGLARICTGWHWPIDVLASGIIGYILVKLCLAPDLSKYNRTRCL